MYRVRRLRAIGLAAVIAAATIGCGDRPAPLNTAPSSDPPARAGGAFAALPVPPPEKPGARGDTRTYWAYDGGHLAQGVGDAWFEHNAEAQKARGKPWEFRETGRTAEHVELYDASRAVQVRLTATEMQARWDKDGKDAEWKALQTGKWGKPE